MLLYIFTESNEGWYTSDLFSPRTSKEEAQKIWDRLKDGGSSYQYAVIDTDTEKILGQLGHHSIVESREDWMLDDPTVMTKAEWAERDQKAKEARAAARAAKKRKKEESK